MGRKRGYSPDALRPVERELLRKLRNTRFDFPGRRERRDVGKLWCHVTADKYD